MLYILGNGNKKKKRIFYFSVAEPELYQLTFLKPSQNLKEGKKKSCCLLEIMII